MNISRLGVINSTPFFDVQLSSTDDSIAFMPYLFIEYQRVASFCLFISFKHETKK